MIAKERKKEIGKMFAEDPDGDWKQGLNHEEQLLVLSWEYASYAEKLKITEEIMKSVEAELHEKGCPIGTDQRTRENRKEYKRIELDVEKKDYRRLKEKATCVGCSIGELLEAFIQDLLEENVSIDKWLIHLSSQNEEDFLMYLTRKELLNEIEGMLDTIEDCNSAIEACTKELSFGIVRNNFGGIQTYCSWERANSRKSKKEWKEGLENEIRDALSEIEEVQNRIKNIWKRYLKENNKEKYDGAFYLEMSRVVKWIEDSWILCQGEI